MKLLVVVILAVALQASVHARPEPGLRDIFAALGFGSKTDLVPAVIAPPAADTSSLVATVIDAEAPADLIQAETDKIMDAFKDLLGDLFQRLPFPKASNPFNTILSSFLTQLEATEAIKSSTSAGSIIVLVKDVVAQLEEENPYAAVAQHLNEVGSTIADGVFEFIPVVLGQLFSNTQSRSMSSFLGDVRGIMTALVSQVQKTLGGVGGLFNYAKDDIMDGVQTIVANISNIHSDATGFNKVVDMLQQVIGVVDVVIAEVEGATLGTIDHAVQSISAEFNKDIAKVNDLLETRIAATLSTMANGAFQSCVAPISNSLEDLGLGLNSAVEGCINTEINIVHEVVTNVRSSLSLTSAFIGSIGEMVDWALHFNVWKVATHVAPTIKDGLHMVGSFSLIAPKAAEVGGIQARVPVCLAASSMQAIASATVSALPITTCAFK